MLKTCSMGGCGDAFIVSLKINQLEQKEGIQVKNLFIESNEKACSLIKEFVGNKHDVLCDPDYQNNYFNGKYQDFRPINTAWSGVYHFPGPDGIQLEDKFAKLDNNKEKVYDICMQVSAGTHSSRHWKFSNLFKFRDLLKSRGHRVVLVGSDEKYQERDDEDNFVCKTNLQESMDVVDKSKVYVGLSGFHTYRSLAQGTKNIHLEESDIHNYHYLHPSWKDNRYGIKIGSPSEIIQGLRYWGFEI